MSLILDALRRADAERERGAVPGLHAQPAPLPDLPARPSARWPWVLGASLGLALLIAAAYGWLQRDSASVTARPNASPAAAGAPAPLAPAPAQQPVPGSAAAPSASVAVPAAQPPQPPAAPTVREPARPQPIAEPAPWPSAATAQKGPPSSRVPAAASAAASSPASAPAETAIVAREQLPEAIRAQLPPLAIGGSIYSASAPDRSILIDGRLLREGDRLNADLTLEQIRPKSAVLRFKGQRFEVSF